MNFNPVNIIFIDRKCSCVAKIRGYACNSEPLRMRFIKTHPLWPFKKCNKLPKILTNRVTNLSCNFAGKKCRHNCIRETFWKITVCEPQKEKIVLPRERNCEVKKYLELSSARFQLCALVLSVFSLCVLLAESRLGSDRGGFAVTSAAESSLNYVIRHYNYAFLVFHGSPRWPTWYGLQYSRSLPSSLTNHLPCHLLVEKFQGDKMLLRKLFLQRFYGFFGSGEGSFFTFWRIHKESML
jgi:hypothetical protein